MLQISAPGLTSSPALAAVLGLDVALTLASLIVSTAITPLTASLFTHIYLGTALASPVAFGLKLFAIIAGCALAATVIRRMTGDSFIEAQRERIDGLSMIAMSTFAIAAMDGVVDHFRADPLLVVGLTALAFALALAMTPGAGEYASPDTVFCEGWICRSAAYDQGSENVHAARFPKIRARSFRAKHRE